MTDSAPCDTVLVGGHLIDPAQGLDGSWTLAIRGGRAAAVLPADLPVQAA
jgi:predicted amidohydrolase